MKETEYQIHQYKSGHQLIESSILLARKDQDVLDQLSDISGALRPDEIFAPYFTCYPLPSKSHFVVARTWQDLGAPRSGCVFTRSHLIPMDEWSNTNHIEDVFTTLLNYQPNVRIEATTQNPIEVSEPVKENYILELVEALFLEERRPIVVFNAKAATTTVVRLYTSLWPNLRSSFSTCTLALSPRKVGNRDFDIQFATTSSRAKFSDWNGRKIEAASTSKNFPRHRWTETIAYNFFGNKELHSKYVPISSLSTFRELGNESALRLALLWQELTVKAETSPTAVLGLLDIANSQPAVEAKLVEDLKPTIYRVLQRIQLQLEPFDEWQFFLALLGKFSRLAIGLPLLRAVKIEMDNLANSWPESALEFLTSNNNNDQEIPPLLCASLGTGISAQKSTLTEFFSLPTLTSKYGLHLSAASDAFAKALSTFWRTNDRVQSKLIEAAKNLPYKTTFRSCLRLSKQIYDDRDVDLLQFIFDFANSEFKFKLLHTVCANTRFSMSAINVWLAALPSVNEDFGVQLLSEIHRYWSKTSDWRFLVELVLHTPDHLTEILNSPSISADIKGLILRTLLDDSEFVAYAQVLNDKYLVNDLLNILLSAEEKSPTNIVNIFAYSGLDVDRGLSIMTGMSKHGLPVDYGGLIKFLSRCFSSASRQYYPQIATLLTYTSARSVNMLISAATASVLGIQRQIDNVELLLESNLHFGSELASNISIITDVLSHSNIQVIREDILIIWSRLLEAADIVRNEQDYAASSALDYAFRHPVYKTVHLLLPAFTIIYSRLKSGNSFEWLPIFFKDWDKCKTLRHQLISIYSNSSWPPVGLFILSVRLDFFWELTNTLSKSKSGEQMIREAIKELKTARRTSETTFIIEQLSRLNNENG